jgi:hypothetical protein
VPSELALASTRPAGEKTTHITRAVCPFSVRNCLPLATSYRRTVRSTLPLASLYWSAGRKVPDTFSSHGHRRLDEAVFAAYG